MSANLDRARGLLVWLTGDATRDEQGWSLSWAGSEKPGYPYPEASAYVLHLLARWPGPLSERMAERARELQSCIESQLTATGALGRVGIDYVFDTAIGLCALNALAETGAEVSARALDAGLGFVVEGLRRGAACRRDGAWFAEDRWSLSWQPHLLKCLRALHGADHAGIRERLMELSGFQNAGGAFALSNTDVVDAHVHAYALEGLLAMEQTPPIRTRIRRGIEWLASVQQADGGVPRHAPGEPVGFCDTTAQAVRLFILSDRNRYADNIARGLKLLERLRHPAGGLRYSPETLDCPTWGVVFACQAWLMLDGRHASGDLI